MEELAKEKIETFKNLVVANENWDLNDELMCQVFGFTLFGYALGVGRFTCFLDVEDIHELTIEQLTSLGIGTTYAKGMVQRAFDVFSNNGEESFLFQLIEVGQSFFAFDDVQELVELVFINTNKARN